MSLKIEKKGILQSENFEEDLQELRRLAEKIQAYTEEEQRQWPDLSLEKS